MADETENKYSRFYRDTGIDLHAEIAAGGSEGGLDNYYDKTETDSLLADKANEVDLSTLNVRVTDLEENPAGGVTDHGALTGLNDDDHTQYLNDIRGDARYYTKTQVDTSLAGKSDTTHNHDSRYFTETEVNTLLVGKANTTTVDALDDRVSTLEGSTGPDLTNYYNKTETNSLLDAKATDTDLDTHTSNTSNPHLVTKSQVGLSNVDNTADLSKPVSTATQTALDDKAALNHNHDTRYYTETESDTLLSGKANTAHTHNADDVNAGTLNIARIPTGISGTTVALGNHSHTKADVGLGNVDNTSDASKPVSTAQQTALDGKQPLDSDLTAIAGIAPTNNDVIQRKSGAWINRTPAQLKTDLSLTKTDVGLANVDNTSDANKPISTATQTALNLKTDTTTFNLTTRAPINGQPRAVKPSVPIGVDASHSAFPGICKLANGNLLLVWRQGSNHFTSRDGSIKTSISTDLGRSWSASSTAIASVGDGVDYRDPSLAVSSDGARVYLTYFKGTAVLAAAGVFLRISTDSGQTWGSEIRIDSGLAYSAISSPVIELSNGNLLAFMYGRSGVETIDSVWYSRSTNNGSTWSAPTRIANGTADARDYQEPWPVRSGNNIVVLFRWGSSGNIGKIHATDGTGTTWQTAASQFAGSGRPSAVWTSYGNIIVTYRGTDGSTLMRSTSNATGISWNPPSYISYPLLGGMMTYSAPYEVANGQIICPWSEEINGGASTSKVVLTYINEGGGHTPLGIIPSGYEASIEAYDSTAFATTFYQANGTPTYPWQVVSGAATVTDGLLQSTSADNTPDLIVVGAGGADQIVEADIIVESASLAGIGVIFKMVDASNYCFFTYESNPLHAKIYRVDAGTPTALTDIVAGLQLNVYNRFKVHTRGDGVWCYLNDRLITEVALTAGSFSTAKFAGVRLNAQSGVAHKVRRFVVGR